MQDFEKMSSKSVFDGDVTFSNGRTSVAVGNIGYYSRDVGRLLELFIRVGKDEWIVFQHATSKYFEAKEWKFPTKDEAFLFAIKWCIESGRLYAEPEIAEYISQVLDNKK